MDKPIIIGLTGPTGAGKSIAAAAMQASGCAVVDADAAAKEAVEPGMPCIKELVEEFGDEIMTPEGGIRRSMLAQKAFASPDKTARLNAITHPWIVARIMEQVEAFKAENYRIIVLDAPLLYESGIDKACNMVVAVTAPQEDRLARIMRRDGISRQAALQRMSAQKEEAFYTEHADYVLHNDRHPEDLYHAAEELVKALGEDSDGLQT